MKIKKTIVDHRIRVCILSLDSLNSVKAIEIFTVEMPTIMINDWTYNVFWNLKTFDGFMKRTSKCRPRP